MKNESCVAVAYQCLVASYVNLYQVILRVEE